MTTQTIARRLFTLAVFALLSACGSLVKTPVSNISSIENELGFQDGKFRLCRESCPKRTAKFLDDPGYALEQVSPIRPVQLNLPVVQPSHVAAMEGKKIDIFIVQFDFAKRTPTKVGLKRLKHLADVGRTAQRIELQGSTDDIGTKNYNNSLARARVNFVYRWLQEHGVTARISVEAVGACCHPSPYNKTESSLIQMRRVKASVQRTDKEVNIQKSMTGNESTTTTQ